MIVRNAITVAGVTSNWKSEYTPTEMRCRARPRSGRTDRHLPLERIAM